MKTFRTIGTGSEQTISEIETDKIPLYPTEQDLLDDLANLEVGQIVGVIDPAESELIGTLIQRIQALESKLESDDVYSTDETLTGKTLVINGVEKPIYRKVINGNYTVGSEMLSDVEYIVKANGYAYDTGATTAEPFPFMYPNYTKSWAFNMSTHKVTYTGDSAKNIFATFEYTKVSA